MFGVPSNLKQALDYEDYKYYKAVIPGEIVNHEVIVEAFRPPIPREPHMKVTPTRFLFSQKLISLDERKQDAKSRAYKAIPGSSAYDHL